MSNYGTEKTRLNQDRVDAKGAISGVSDSIHPSMPNFAAAYAVQNNWPAIPAVEEMVSSRPKRCLRITDRTARVTFIGPNVEWSTYLIPSRPLRAFVRRALLLQSVKIALSIDSPETGAVTYG